MKEKLSKEQLEKWRAAGYSYREIAKAAGVCMSTVRNSLARYGMVGAYFVTEEEKQNFCKLRQQGLSTVEISEITGRSKSAVNNALKEAGMIGKQTEETKEEIKDIFEPRVIRYAEKRKPKAVKIIAEGKEWWDVSDFWIPY